MSLNQGSVHGFAYRLVLPEVGFPAASQTDFDFIRTDTQTSRQFVACSEDVVSCLHKGMKACTHKPFGCRMEKVNYCWKKHDDLIEEYTTYQDEMVYRCK